jgi:hypothetical protein
MDKQMDRQAPFKCLDGQTYEWMVDWTTGWIIRQTSYLYFLVDECIKGRADGHSNRTIDRQIKMLGWTDRKNYRQANWMDGQTDRQRER